MVKTPSAASCATTVAGVVKDSKVKKQEKQNINPEAKVALAGIPLVKLLRGGFMETELLKSKKKKVRKGIEKCKRKACARALPKACVFL